MIRTALVACALLSIATFAACQSAGSSADATPGTATPAAPSAAEDPQPTAPAERNKADEPNTGDGIYTVAQAARGEAVFRQICSECHEAADWTDPLFLARWNEDSVYRFWYYIYERMPHGRPYSLSREQVTDALTYILQLNGMPPGPSELGTDDDSIDDHWIIWGTPR